MKVTILGCGSSGGVPRIGNDWGACDPDNPKNRRSRCSILVERGATRILVDTAPDLRQQMLDANISRLDAVFYTHLHADQAHGIDDLRVFFLRERRRIPVYADPMTLAAMEARFDYCFEEIEGYPPILQGNELAAPVSVGAGESAVGVTPITVRHGRIDALGFVFQAPGGARVGYFPDVSEIPEPAFDALHGLDLLIVDALRYRPHPSHAHVERSLAWIDRLGPDRALLTNMHVDLDYETLKAECPANVEPAYDGQVLCL